MAARILIAEDHADSLELMMYLLRANGYDVLTANNGLGALELVRTARPDLVLCDLQMPGLSGCELARRVKEDPSLSDIPLVAVTAFSMLGDRETVLATGFDGYFSKPIEAESFVVQLEAYLPPHLRAVRPAVPVRKEG